MSATILENRRGPLMVLSINRPQVINALSLQAFVELDAALTRAETDASIHCVVLQGEGDRGYCAGGDVKLVVQPPTELGADYPKRFFETEYALDQRIYSYSKPIAVYAHGISMGGGLGLMEGAPVRVVAENATLAMPEISIGLFPDVGASYFLPRLKSKWQEPLEHRLGLFLGLTGARLRAEDAVRAGIADFLVPLQSKPEWLTQLEQTTWGSDAAMNLLQLHRISESLSKPPTTFGPSSVEPERDTIAHLLSSKNPLELSRRASVALQEAQLDPSRKWMQACLSTFMAGSPLSTFLTWEAFHRGSRSTLSEAFEMELKISLQSCKTGEFAEGVRALLLEKTGSPRWNPSTWAEVTTSMIEPFFS